MRPGEFFPALVDDQQATAIVVGTSRHRNRLTRADAAHELATHVARERIGHDDVDAGPLEVVLAGRDPWRWFSIPATEDHACYSDGCDAEPGAWCTEGQGQAYVEVLTVTHGEVYDLLDNPDQPVAHQPA